MALIVQKYGGTSVGSVERIKAVAERVVRTAKEGNRVVVVVSAMSGETDKLISLANQLSARPGEREMDMLLSSGERVTSALTAMAVRPSATRRYRLPADRQASSRTRFIPRPGLSGLTATGSARRWRKAMLW